MEPIHVELTNERLPVVVFEELRQDFSGESCRIVDGEGAGGLSCAGEAGVGPGDEMPKQRRLYYSVDEAMSIRNRDQSRLD